MSPAPAIDQPGQAEAPDRLLEKADVCGWFHISAPTLTRWIRDGRFPSPLRLGKKQLWPARQVAGFIAELERSAAR